MYEEQLYVQTPSVIKEALEFSKFLEPNSATYGRDDSNGLALPRVRWRPYATTPSRTPIMIAQEKTEEEGSGAMALWNQYPFGRYTEISLKEYYENVNGNRPLSGFYHIDVDLFTEVYFYSIN